MSDPSSQPTQPLTEGPCQPVYVHTYGLDRETWEKLFDRVADAAHALDESVSCSGGNECALCVEQPTREELYAELSRLRAENTALAERGPAEPDEEFDAVREHAAKVGDKKVKDLLDAFDWLRSELSYSNRILNYTRQKHAHLEGAFDLVIAQCGKLRAERDGVGELLDKVVDLHPAGFCETCNVEGPCPTRRALGLDQSGEGQANGAA